MDIQSSVLNQLFELYSVIIQGWVSPLKPADLAHGGIPKSLYDEQPQGLECLVDPWGELQLRSWTMAADDRVDLYVNDDPTPVTGKTVAPGEEQLRVRLYVPHGRLRNGVNRLHYKVIRPGGNSEDSRDLNVLYYLRSPGEPAPNGLDLVIPPDVIKDGVSAVRAAQGVEFGFTYSNRRVYDRIRFQLGDETVEWEITDASVPVVKTLFTDTFQQVGDNPNLLLDFVVFDQLGNFSRSSTKEVDVHLGRVNLSAAILREIPTENNDDPNTVDLAKLNGNPLSALIHLVETIWKVGDSIKLVFTAELNGGVVATHEETSPVTQLPTQFVWSIPNNKIIPNSTVKVVYEQVRGGAVIATSLPATAQVIGEGVIKLNPATLVAPAVSPIDLWLYLNGVTVRTEFLTAQTGDKAQLIEINPPSGATPFPAVAFNANKRTNTVLTQAFLAARHGTQLELRWALIRGGKEIARSGPLVLSLKRIADGDARFPTPVVAGQTGQELDVTKLVAGDKLSIAPWPLQVAGHYVWLRYDGFNSNGARIFFDDLKGVPHNEAQGLTRPVLVDWLNTLKHGTAVTITFRVNFDGVANEAGATMFPIATYIIKNLLHTLYETFESSPLGVIPIGSSMQLPHMKIIPVRGEAMIRVGVHLPPYFAGKCLLGNLNFSIKIELQQAAKNIKFALGDTDRVPCLISYFDEQNEVLVIRQSPPFGSLITVWEQYIPPAPRKIKIIIIEGTDADLDNFTMNF
ncbi:hypothetical protein [Pseudomonas fluorescens]|uniref:hypothetical protein n=1 Tax=Pseudomonas fluorescens TaxID=294 RepID=UPI000ABA881F|nr:hypothetical protein [Pseudomonas fluorescens]